MNLIETFYIKNDGGTSGFAKVRTGKVYEIAPLANKDYTKSNPETLIGASLATCMNATLMHILKVNKIEARSLVEVQIDLMLNKEERRYVFVPTVRVGIEGLSLEETKIHMEHADRKCPVSNLIDKKFLTFIAVNFEELAND